MSGRTHARRRGPQDPDAEELEPAAARPAPDPPPPPELGLDLASGEAVLGGAFGRTKAALAKTT